MKFNRCLGHLGVLPVSASHPEDFQILSKHVFISVIFEYDSICVVQWASATLFSSPWGSENSVLIRSRLEGLYIKTKMENVLFYRLIQCDFVVMLYSLFLVIHHNS